MSVHDMGQREAQHPSPSLGQAGTDVYLPVVGTGSSRAVPEARIRPWMMRE